MPLTYDRRAPEPLMKALQSGGAAHSLVEYGRCGRYSLDLQLRGYAGKPGHWATLYVGLTKVLDLHYRANGFRLDAHQSYKQPKFGWRPAWSRAMSEARLADAWTEVESYLERVIPSIGERYHREGAVQSAISGFEAKDMVVIDRECSIAFSNAAEKKSVTNKLVAPLLDAITGGGGPSWLSSAPKSLGGECDALAIGPRGELVVIEVKPATASAAAIAWSPLQVRHYARLFEAWARQARGASEILRGMLQQRIELGLTRQQEIAAVDPSQMRAVVAIGRDASKEALKRLRQVHARLADAGFDDPPFELAEVSLTGRLDFRDLAAVGV